MKGTDRCPLEFAEKASHCVVGGLVVLGGGMCSASQCRKAATQSGKTVIYIVIIRRISANLINFGVEILIRRFSQSKMRSRRGVVLSTQQCGVARGEGSLVSKWKPFRGNSSNFSGIREPSRLIDVVEDQ